jgi:hypothetical protein
MYYHVPPPSGLSSPGLTGPGNEGRSEGPSINGCFNIWSPRIFCKKKHVPRQAEFPRSPSGERGNEGTRFPWLTGPPSGPGTVLWTVPYIFLTEKYRTKWPRNEGTRFPGLTGPPSGPGTVLRTVPYIFLTEKYRT